MHKLVNLNIGNVKCINEMEKWRCGVYINKKKSISMSSDV